MSEVQLELWQLQAVPAGFAMMSWIKLEHGTALRRSVAMSILLIAGPLGFSIKSCDIERRRLATPAVASARHTQESRHKHEPYLRNHDKRSSFFPLWDDAAFAASQDILSQGVGGFLPGLSTSTGCFYWTCFFSESCGEKLGLTWTLRRGKAYGQDLFGLLQLLMSSARDGAFELGAGVGIIEWMVAMHPGGLQPDGITPKTRYARMRLREIKVNLMLVLPLTVINHNNSFTP